MEYGEGAKCLIRDGTMKFTNPDEFNDPFDCSPSYSLENINKINKKVLKKAGDELGYSPSERVLNKRKMIANLKRSITEGGWQSSLKNDVGICSLTTKPCNLLMWAHYADNHKGIVVEFKNEIPHNPEHSEEYLTTFHVKYQKQKPKIDFYNIDVAHDLLTKGIDWDYEDEIRCLDMHRKAGIHPYKKELLKSIILGIKFDENKFKEIESLIKKVNEQHNLDIKIYKAKILKDQFKIYIPGHPIYGKSSW